MIIDTHAHINHDMLKNELGNIINDLNNDKLSAIVCPSYDIRSCKTTLEFVQKYEKVFGALAIHPSEDKSWNNEIKQFITTNLNNPKIVALGEYGLDYHFEPYNKVTQQNIMQEQLEIAKNAKIPSIFHVRDAFDDFIPIMKENLNSFVGGVVHCYDSTIDNAKKLLDLDLMISFTGIITFKNRDELRDVVKYVPLDRFMLETDSPYLAPMPYRGQVCTPQMVKLVYDKVAELRNIKKEELENIVAENTKRFFTKLVI